MMKAPFFWHAEDFSRICRKTRQIALVEVETARSKVCLQESQDPGHLHTITLALRLSSRAAAIIGSHKSNPST